MSRIKIELPETFSFSTHIPVQVRDINYGGHLGNDSLVSLLHEARIRYLQSLGCSELDACGTGLIMSDLAVTYKGEGFRGDELLVEIAAGEFSSRGFDLLYRVGCRRETGTILIATAKTGMLCFDYSTRKVAALPGELREKLEVGKG
ncbi:thioesterase family protein [Compostibacter hankyongensis]|uniref:Thioesterase family protein n=1 Tax=Compostibacter hankyongensis TaxID=1007089 RepID=A0ABP8GBG8_9BACT